MILETKSAEIREAIQSAPNIDDIKVTLSCGTVLCSKRCSDGCYDISTIEPSGYGYCTYIYPIQMMDDKLKATSARSYIGERPDWMLIAEIFEELFSYDRRWRIQDET